MIPIDVDHNSEKPVGRLEIEDGRAVIRLMPDSGITPEQLCNLEIGYIAKEVDGGTIVEAELVEVSIITKGELNNA